MSSVFIDIVKLTEAVPAANNVDDYDGN